MDVTEVRVAVDMNAAVWCDVDDAGPPVSTSSKSPLFKCFFLSRPHPARDGRRRTAALQSRGRETEGLSGGARLLASGWGPPGGAHPGSRGCSPTTTTFASPPDADLPPEVP